MPLLKASQMMLLFPVSLSLVGQGGVLLTTQLRPLLRPVWS